MSIHAMLAAGGKVGELTSPQIRADVRDALALGLDIHGTSDGAVRDDRYQLTM